MKKVIALILAAAMLSVAAFAESSPNEDGDYGGTMSGYFDGYGDQDYKDITLGASSKLQIPLIVNPNCVVGIDQEVLKAIATAHNLGTNTREASETEVVVRAINSDYYSLSSIKYPSGKKYISSVKIDDEEDMVLIRFKENYALSSNKEFILEFTLKGKKPSGSSAQRPTNVKLYVEGEVGFGTSDGSKYAYLDIDDGEIVDESEGYDPPEQFIYRVRKSTSSSTSYAEMEFETSSDDEVTVYVPRIFDGDRFFIYSTGDSDKKVLEAYADTNADLSFLNFVGEPTFSSTATMYIYKEKGTYVYERNSNGSLSETNATWSNAEDCILLKTRSLGYYVFSDKKLDVSAMRSDDWYSDDDYDPIVVEPGSGGTTATVVPGTGNPETGANDVVGLAVVLALAALLSGAALTLRKSDSTDN